MNDVTIVGSCKKADGIGQNSIGFVSCLHQDVKMNVIHTRTLCGDGLSPEILSVFEESSTSVGKVAILTSSIFWYDQTTIYRDLPENSHIKIAYSMIESSQLAEEGVALFNRFFDAVVVPDPWVREVYLRSGVSVPIFILPLALDLEDFLEEPLHSSSRKPFIFLNTCAFMERKNHLLLIDAFHEAFRDRRDVKLILHGRRGSSSDAFPLIEKRLEEFKSCNIELQRTTLSRREYLSLMSQADCFISLSKGEGFGVPPREALALGIPCILTNNSAHQTCCRSGFVSTVTSDIPELAFCPLICRYCGEEYNCHKEDAVMALLDMLDRYPEHLKRAHHGREWVKQYLPGSLKPYYLALVKPARVVLGDRDELGEGCLMTSSKRLYEKYLSL